MRKVRYISLFFIFKRIGTQHKFLKYPNFSSSWFSFITMARTDPDISITKLFLPQDYFFTLSIRKTIKKSLVQKSR